MAMNKGLRSQESWMKRHLPSALLAAVIIVALAGGFWLLNLGRQNKPQDLPAIKADERVLAEGIVYPVHYSQMVMPVNGMVGEVLAKEGDRVQAGQPIIRLVRADYQARVDSAGSAVKRAEAAVKQAGVKLAEAEREWQRQQRMDAAGATSRQQLEQAETAVERDRAGLAQAEAELAAQKDKLSESEGELEKTELRATIDGTVAFLDVKPGEHAPAGEILVRLADETAWEVRSDDLTELAVVKVRAGDTAILTFDGIPGLEIPGRVQFIRPYGEKKRGDITYTVFIAPDYWDERLRWMMTAQIAIAASK
ncbi:efflux RND transporter periplasmic adaptor subunit [Acetonema longum]|uniref:Multidrug resistance efflux pump-like protein n=1 Tax=Acetonema longum DSM 6540 TaxID=1009370 RepID=F7NDT4_9FIRM|nr:efflux RND transporter periplasmic adaptor subunit [Acetonema longum]EGO65805.1 multidrug resistance efflux pump-like protein [Acetonema longum DSM 6540]